MIRAKKIMGLHLLVEYLFKGIPMGVIQISKPVVTLGIYDIGFVSFEQRNNN